MAELFPGSRVLKSAEPVLPRCLLDSEQRKELDGELDNWTREMRMLNTDLDEERNDNQRPPLPRPAIRQIVNCNEVCLTFVHFYDMQLCVVINCSFIYNKICKIVGF